jgi:hypothetical protein
VLTADERIVGHCASVPSVMWIGGEERIFARVALPLLAPEHRSRIEAEGAHERLAARVVESTFRPEGDLALQALVHEDDWRAMEHLFGLEIVRTVSLLKLELDGERDAWEPDAGLHPLTSFGEETRWLWDRCAGGFGASVVRDAALYRWRFGARAGRRYRSFGMRDGSGVLRGFAAYTSGAWLTRRSGVLVDWLVPPEEEETGAALLQAVRARAHADGVTSVMTTLVEWSPWFERFQRAGFAVHPSPLFLVARCAARRFDQLWLRDHWWLTLADTCLV